MSRRESAAMHRETSARLRKIEDKVTPSRAGPGSKGSLNYLVKSKHFSVPLGAEQAKHGCLDMSGGAKQVLPGSKAEYGAGATLEVAR